MWGSNQVAVIQVKLLSKINLTIVPPLVSPSMRITLAQLPLLRVLFPSRDNIRFLNHIHMTGLIGGNHLKWIDSHCSRINHVSQLCMSDSAWTNSRTSPQKNDSMSTSTPCLTADQLNLKKYAVLTKSSIVALRSSLNNYYTQPVFGPITTKYLNRVVVKKVRKSLALFQLNPNGKSKNQPLTQGYCVYNQFQHLTHPTTVFKELTPGQYQSQFYPPENQDDNQEDDMVQFSLNIPNSFNIQEEAISLINLPFMQFQLSRLHH